LSLTYASSHVYVKINETLTLNIDNNDANSEVTWVISQEGSIIDTLKKSTFKYAFKEGGNYLVRLNVMSKRGDLKSSLIEITVSEKIPSFSKLSAKLTTIPEIKDGVITLSGEKAEVLFAFSDSTGNIKNYELESDIFVDSDNDGESDNDIDNKNDASYISGTYFKRLYINTGIPSRAILTVRDENGNEQKASVTIVFDENSENLVVKPLNLKVTTLPKQKENGIIELSQRENSIFIFAGQSSGKIKQYKIDENLEVDSDGDGDSKNDFDNKGTDSADTGVSYPIKIDKDKKTQSFSVTVVGEYDEKRKEYTVKNISSYSNSNNKGVSLEPLLFSSRTKISEGETVTFNIFNYPKNSTVSWDFNGDGIFEIKDSDVKKVEYLYAKEGIYNVSFFLKEVGESPVIQRKTIQVLNKSEGQLKTEPPFAYFYPQTNGNKASFLSSQSRADENLANTDLSYSWNFGDDFKAQGPNVEHVYEFEGNYTVTLTVTDSIGRTGVYSDLVIIEELTNNFEESQHGGSVIRENNKKIEEQKNSGHTENDVVNSDDLKNIDDNPEKNPESGQTDGWKKIEPVIKNSPTIPINSNSNSNSKSSFSWWVIILVILLLLPFLFLLKKKMDNPEKSFKDIVKELNPKKSIEDLKHAENIEAPLEVEKEELLEQKEIKEEEKIKDEESDLDIISEENLPDWMQNAGEEEKTEDNINTENIVEGRRGRRSRKYRRGRRI